MVRISQRPEGSLVFYEVIDKAVFKLLGQAEKLLLATRRHQLSWELEQQRGSHHLHRQNLPRYNHHDFPDLGALEASDCHEYCLVSQ